jgi:methylmalonyl-CoA mutase
LKQHLFNFNFISIDFVKKIEAIANRKEKKYCNFDPIGQLAHDGNWFTDGNFLKLTLLLKATKTFLYLA